MSTNVVYTESMKHAITNEQRFNRYIAIRVEASDREKLSQVAERLSLKQSEVSRRALRLGLKFFKDVTLPGSRETNAEAE